MRKLLATALVLAGALGFVGCAAEPEVDKYEQARVMIDVVYEQEMPGMTEVDSYEELASGLAKDAVEYCDSSAVYISGLNGDQLLIKAFEAAQEVVCD